MEGSTPIAGWYDDPEYAGTKRYWDGKQWTDHREPPLPGTPAPSSAAASQVSSIIRYLILVGFVVFVIVLAAALANGA